MSSRTFDGNPESAGPGYCPAPPPPPPPPGQVPALRINTVEAPVPRRSLPNSNNNPYEPPAAIQNAMMTKDKKPFTYTPGMGGKLDLSQIRSPRMARRVAKNANDEGIEGPPKSSLATEPRPVSAAPNLYIQPQVAVPVFPTNVPLQPSANRNSVAPPSRVPSNASDRGAEIQRPTPRVETKPMPQVVSPQPTPPETPTTPPQVTLAKAPTPWLQNKNKPQDELPEWAKRSSVIRPSSSTSPESPVSQPAQIHITQAQPQVLQTIQLQQTASPTRQQQPPPPSRQQTQPHERVIPLRIEDRPSVFSVKNEPGHHQLKQQPQQSQPSSHHQQRWGNPTPPQTPSQTQAPQFHNQNHQQQYQQPPRPHSSGGGTYIVPIMVEGSSNNGPSTYNQQQPIRNQNVQNPSPRVIVQRGPPSPQIQQQGEPGPVQSRSFRVLQKITDTDVPDEVDGEQLRKLQLTEDDKVLMNKFKEQVDGDGNYLHQEEDPRYRGAAIPSRAFRFLQNMTDSGDVTTTAANAPRAPSAINKRQNRNSRTFEESQANLPPSEQQAPEPKKYTGSAIPSRSFRILQAMTSPENIAKQENRQAVIICRTETSMQPGNQHQGVFLSSSSPHDSSSMPLAEQSQLLSQLSVPQSQSPQSHHSQSSEIPSSLSQSHESQCPLSQVPIATPQQSRPNVEPLSRETDDSPLSESRASPSQLEATSMQSSQPQPRQLPLPELLLSRSHDSQMKSLQMQYSQFQPSLPPPMPPPFWQHPDGSLWWGYYPVHYPSAPNATPSPPSSSSSSPSASANNHDSLSNNLHSMPYENAYHRIVCNHHQDGTAFAYYHPFYDQRFYAAAIAAAAMTSSPPSDVSSLDAEAAQRCTELSSSLSSPSAETLGRATSALPEDSSCSSKLVYASAPSTMPRQAACPAAAFTHRQTTITLPGHDSNCNPCLERTEHICAGETIFRCQPAFVHKPDFAHGHSGCNAANSVDQGMRNGWIGQNPGLIEPGPPPWIRNDERNSKDKSDLPIDSGNEVGWNLDGTIGKPENSQRSDERFVKAKLNDLNTDSVASPRADRRSVDEKSAWIDNDADAARVAEEERRKPNEIETEQRWSKTNGDAGRVDRDSEIGETRWNRIDNASRNLTDHETSIPMNILHDECNVNESPVIDKVKNGDDRCEATTDTDSDTDSGDSSGDVEPACTDRATNTDDESETESDSDDSDSYLAYSTGLNPHNKFARQTCNRVEGEYGKSQTATTISEDAFDESTFAMSSDKLNSTDCESCVEEDEDGERAAKIDDTDRTDLPDTNADDVSPHRLSVIHEDSEQHNDRGGSTPSAIGSDGWQNVTDDPNESATVIVSLPLKFRHAATENEPEKIDDVSVSLKLTDDTDISADFTLKKKNLLQESMPNDKEDRENDIDFWQNEETKSDTKIIDNGEDKSPKEETNDDSKNVNQDDSIDFWETITSGRVTPDLNLKSRRQRGLDRYFWKEEIPLEEENEKSSGDDEEIKDESSTILKIEDSSRSDEEAEEEEEEEEDDDEESEIADCPDAEEAQITEAEKEDSTKTATTPLFELTEAKNDENEESSGRSNLENSKHLLSVQNSRDETDDEDSGVTSDMSRLISEVDTDSECGPTRKINSYKRTQTHSRLFRLLSREDDAQVSEETTNSAARRDRLSLPLKSSGFSYDECNHYSNYSSGLNSPDYSPVHEGTWRRLHGDENPTERSLNSVTIVNDDETTKSRKDTYYENWKKTIADDGIREETISSVDSTRIVHNPPFRGLPNWRFRNNVLCPRIKSTKNVPRTVKINRSAKPVISNSSAAKSVGKSNDNAF